MKVNLPYLHLAALLFYLLMLVFLIFFDSLGPLLGMEVLTSASVTKVVVLSLLFFLGTWGIAALQARREVKKVNALEAEITRLKARLYDLDKDSQSHRKDEKGGKSPVGQNIDPNA